jgi:hypothetical protein
VRSDLAILHTVQCAQQGCCDSKVFRQLLPHTPCRSRSSDGGYPPSQQPQVCTQCKQERAANWFALAHERQETCLAAALTAGLAIKPTSACDGMCLLHLESLPLLHVPNSHAARHTVSHAKGKCAFCVLACMDDTSTAGNLLAGHVHLRPSGSVRRPSARSHQLCQVRRSAGSATRYAQC